MTGTALTQLLIDGDLVRRRRIELGLIQLGLARLLGVSATTIRRVEEQASQRQMPISLVLDLAVVLGLEPRQLLCPVPQLDPDDDDGGEDAAAAEDEAAEDEPAVDDATRVGALLGAAAGWVTVTELADALSWSLERSLDALELLTRRLPASGQRLAWLADRDVRIVAAPADQVVETVTRRNLELAGPDQKAALILHRILDHGPTISTRGTDEQARNRLTAAGLIEIVDGPNGYLTLTELGRYCLCV